ncbi:MAG: hypothetical protein PHI27_07240 [Eubacteriales bacterium]|nr:hypothetical protein [Eubacteriales bacterium]MDD3882030.1 hypothetical protein [Eubacteriales bacterium]MDD4512477.1 hypothetical protein [Eubacteriales bacterium]
MQQSTSEKRGRSGWNDEEKNILLSEVQAAQEEGSPLKSAFERCAFKLGRKPNSIRNYFYQLQRSGEGCGETIGPRFTPFTQDECDKLMEYVKRRRLEGASVRGAVMELAGGDRKRMLRYQNKYRSLIKANPSLDIKNGSELRSVSVKEQTGREAPRNEQILSEMLSGLQILYMHARDSERAEDLQLRLDRLKVKNDLERIKSQVLERRLEGCESRMRDTLLYLKQFDDMPDMERAAKAPSLLESLNVLRRDIASALEGSEKVLET